MFGKSKALIETDDCTIVVNPDALEYINSLKNKIEELKEALRDTEARLDHVSDYSMRLESQLKSITPVIERGTLKPAVSEFCYDCKFAYLDGYSGRLIGCTKDCLCDDYKFKRED